MKLMDKLYRSCTGIDSELKLGSNNPNAHLKDLQERYEAQKLAERANEGHLGLSGMIRLPIDYLIIDPLMRYADETIKRLESESENSNVSRK